MRERKQASRRRDWKILRFWHADDKLDVADAEIGGYLGSERKKSVWLKSGMCECATVNKTLCGNKVTEWMRSEVSKMEHWRISEQSLGKVGDSNKH